MNEYPGELEADFQRVYGLDVIGVYNGTLSVRKAANLAAHLPPGSSVWRAEGGPLAWSDDVALLSAIEFNSHVAWWMKTKDGSRGTKPPKAMRPPPSKSEQAATEAKARQVLARRKARAATKARLDN